MSNLRNVTSAISNPPNVIGHFRDFAHHVDFCHSFTIKHGLNMQALRRLPRIPSHRRHLHLAPPFLLDDYIPRYLTLSSRDAAKKRGQAYGHLRNCNLCPRLCGVNRYETTGMCLIGEKAKVNVIAPHFGEGMHHHSLHGPYTDRQGQNHAFRATMAVEQYS